jgi:hypothetical protein
VVVCQLYSLKCVEIFCSSVEEQLEVELALGWLLRAGASRKRSLGSPGLYNGGNLPKGRPMAQFVEHDMTGDQINYLSLEQVIVAEYYTAVGVGEGPLLILRMSNGQDYELQGQTAEELANVLSGTTVARVSSKRA